MAKVCRGCIGLMSSVFGCERKNNRGSEERLEVTPVSFFSDHYLDTFSFAYLLIQYCIPTLQFSEEDLAGTSVPDGHEQLIFSAIANKSFEEFQSVVSTLTTRDANESRDEVCTYQR